MQIDSRLYTRIMKLQKIKMKRTTKTKIIFEIKKQSYGIKNILITDFKLFHNKFDIYIIS